MPRRALTEGEKAGLSTDVDEDADVIDVAMGVSRLLPGSSHLKWVHRSLGLPVLFVKWHTLPGYD
jgi:hypothetical protein